MFKTLELSVGITAFLCISTANAATTFLPDYTEEAPKNFESENLCIRAVKSNGSKLYHFSDTIPQCPSPKIFDTTCPHDKNWISDCYCPATYNQTCSSPYRGVGEVCDGKYQECCNQTCSSGSTSGCSGSYVTDYTSTNGCGDTCYVCRVKNTCNTSCSSGEDTITTGGTNDDDGKACVRCEEPTPVIPDEPAPCTSCWCNSAYCSSPDLTPDPGTLDPETPPVEDTTKPDTPKTCTPTSCGYSSQKTGEGWSCTSCTYTNSDCSTEKGYNCTYKEPAKTCPPTSCGYSSQPTGSGWKCTSCTYTNADCSTGKGYNCSCTPDVGDPYFKDGNCHCIPCIKYEDAGSDGCGGTKKRCRLYQPIAGCMCQ